MLSMSDRAMANYLADETRALLSKAQPIMARAYGAERNYLLSACNLLALAGRELGTAAQDPADRLHGLTISGGGGSDGAQHGIAKETPRLQA